MKFNLVSLCGGISVLYGSEFGKQLFAEFKCAIDSSSEPNEVIEIDVSGVQVADVSFLRESVVNLVKHFLGKKFFIVYGFDGKISSNWEGAANSGGVNIATLKNGIVDYIGPKMGARDRDILTRLYKTGSETSPRISLATNVSVSNASSCLNRLFKKGLIYRDIGSAVSGGKEYTYTSPFYKRVVSP